MAAVKKYLPPAARILFSVLLLFLLIAPPARYIASFFPLIDIRQLPLILQTARLEYLLAAAAAVALAVLAVICRWQIILGPGRVSFGLLTRLTFIGLFFNNFMPTAAGGDFLKGFYLLRGRRDKMELGFSIIFDRIVGTITILGMGFLAVLIYFPVLPPGPAYAVIFLFIGVLFLLLLSFWYTPRARFTRFLPVGIRTRAEVHLQEAHQAFCRYRNDPGLLFRAIGVSCVSQVLLVLAHYLVTISLSTPVSLRVLFVALPLVWVVSALPSLGGLGIRETGYVFFLRPVLLREEAFALALVMHGFMMINSTVGGFIYLLGVRRKEGRG